MIPPNGPTPSPRQPRPMPAAPLAYRRINPSWPLALQRLHHSCLAVWEAFAELDMGAAQARHDGRPADAQALDALATMAYAAWQSIEVYAAPYVAQHESEHTA